MPISRAFVLAGDATFTVETPTGHRTYRVQHSPANDRWKESWFVKLLTGSDNETSYSYLGKLDEFTGQLVLTARSKLGADSASVRLFNRVMARVWADDHAAYEQHGYQTHHEGCCGRCGRKLTVPESIESGIGPECAKKMGIIVERKPKAEVSAPVREAMSQAAQNTAWKQEFQRLEIEQERLAAMSDPDFLRFVGRQNQDIEDVLARRRERNA